MATETASRDPNYVTTIMGVSLGSPHVPTQIYVDEATHRLLANVTNTFYTNQTGTWDYRAGVSGSPRAFTGRVLGITAHCTTTGSMTIDGGDSIPIPANVGYVWTPEGNLVSPTLVFTGTDTFAVEFVS